MEFAISHLVVIVPMAKQLEGMAKKKTFVRAKNISRKRKITFFFVLFYNSKYFRESYEI